MRAEDNSDTSFIVNGDLWTDISILTNQRVSNKEFIFLNSSCCFSTPLRLGFMVLFETVAT